MEQGVSSQTIIKGLRRASAMAINKIKEIAVSTNEANRRETLTKLAGTAMTSKLIKRNTEFFTKSEHGTYTLGEYPLETLLTRIHQWSLTPSSRSTRTTLTRS